MLVHVWYQITNFEAILLLELLINFEQNGSCDQKFHYSNSQKFILFYFYSSRVQEEEQFSKRASRSLNLDAWSPL